MGLGPASLGFLGPLNLIRLDAPRCIPHTTKWMGDYTSYETPFLSSEKFFAPDGREARCEAVRGRRTDGFGESGRPFRKRTVAFSARLMGLIGMIGDGNQGYWQSHELIPCY